MFIQFFKRRRTNFPTQYTYIAGPGLVHLIKYDEIIEVPEADGYAILSKDGDIIQQVDGPKKTTKKRVSKVRKVVGDLTTA
jgi:hypothetical protein